MFKLPKLSDTIYWNALKTWAQVESDGCTMVPDHYVEACWEHDFHFRYAVTLYGDPITIEQANRRFRDSIQMLSRLRWFSPLSWIRYAAINVFGRSAWNSSRKQARIAPFHLDHPNAPAILDSFDPVAKLPDPESVSRNA